MDPSYARDDDFVLGDHKVDIGGIDNSCSHVAQWKGTSLRSLAGLRGCIKAAAELGIFKRVAKSKLD